MKIGITLAVLLLAGILFEQSWWHLRSIVTNRSEQEAELNNERARKFMDAVDEFRYLTHQHAGEIYGCQNGERELDKYIWLRWEKVDAEITSLGNDTDLANLLSIPTNSDNAYKILAMGNELLSEAERAGGPLLHDPPDWMTNRPEWQVTAEDIRNEHFYYDEHPNP